MADTTVTAATPSPSLPVPVPAPALPLKAGGRPTLPVPTSLLQQRTLMVNNIVWVGNAVFFADIAGIGGMSTGGGGSGDQNNASIGFELPCVILPQTADSLEVNVLMRLIMGLINLQPQLYLELYLDRSIPRSQLEVGGGLKAPDGSNHSHAVSPAETWGDIVFKWTLGEGPAPRGRWDTLQNLLLRRGIARVIRPFANASMVPPDPQLGPLPPFRYNQSLLRMEASALKAASAPTQPGAPPSFHCCLSAVAAAMESTTRHRVWLLGTLEDVHRGDVLKIRIAWSSSISPGFEAGKLITTLLASVEAPLLRRQGGYEAFSVSRQLVGKPLLLLLHSMKFGDKDVANNSQEELAEQMEHAEGCPFLLASPPPTATEEESPPEMMKSLMDIGAYLQSIVSGGASALTVSSKLKRYCEEYMRLVLSDLSLLLTYSVEAMLLFYGGTLKQPTTMTPGSRQVCIELPAASVAFPVLARLRTPLSFVAPRPATFAALIEAIDDVQFQALDAPPEETPVVPSLIMTTTDDTPPTGLLRCWRRFVVCGDILRNDALRQSAHAFGPIRFRCSRRQIIQWCLSKGCPLRGYVTLVTPVAVWLSFPLEKGEGYEGGDGVAAAVAGGATGATNSGNGGAWYAKVQVMMSLPKDFGDATNHVPAEAVEATTTAAAAATAEGIETAVAEGSPRTTPPPMPGMLLVEPLPLEGAFEEVDVTMAFEPDHRTIGAAKGATGVGMHYRRINFASLDRFEQYRLELGIAVEEVTMSSQDRASLRLLRPATPTADETATTAQPGASKPKRPTHAPSLQDTQPYTGPLHLRVVTNDSSSGTWTLIKVIVASGLQASRGAAGNRSPPPSAPSPSSVAPPTLHPEQYYLFSLRKGERKLTGEARGAMTDFERDATEAAELMAEGKDKEAIDEEDDPVTAAGAGGGGGGAAAGASVKQFVPVNPMTDARKEFHGLTDFYIPLGLPECAQHGPWFLPAATVASICKKDVLLFPSGVVWGGGRMAFCGLAALMSGPAAMQHALRDQRVHEGATLRDDPTWKEYATMLHASGGAWWGRQDVVAPSNPAPTAATGTAAAAVVPQGESTMAVHVAYDRRTVIGDVSALLSAAIVEQPTADTVYRRMLQWASAAWGAKAGQIRKPLVPWVPLDAVGADGAMPLMITAAPILPMNGRLQRRLAFVDYLNASCVKELLAAAQPVTPPEGGVAFFNALPLVTFALFPRMLFPCHHTHHLKITQGDIAAGKTQTAKGWTLPVGSVHLDAAMARLMLPRLPCLWRSDWDHLPAALRVLPSKDVAACVAKKQTTTQPSTATAATSPPTLEADILVADSMTLAKFMAVLFVSHRLADLPSEYANKPENYKMEAREFHSEGILTRLPRAPSAGGGGGGNGGGGTTESRTAIDESFGPLYFRSRAAESQKMFVEDRRMNADMEGRGPDTLSLPATSRIVSQLCRSTLLTKSHTNDADGGQFGCVECQRAAGPDDYHGRPMTEAGLGRQSARLRFACDQAGTALTCCPHNKSLNGTDATESAEQDPTFSGDAMDEPLWLYDVDGGRIRVAGDALVGYPENESSTGEYREKRVLLEPVPVRLGSRVNTLYKMVSYGQITREQIYTYRNTFRKSGRDVVEWLRCMLSPTVRTTTNGESVMSEADGIFNVYCNVHEPLYLHYLARRTLRSQLAMSWDAFRSSMPQRNDEEERHIFQQLCFVSRTVMQTIAKRCPLPCYVKADARLEADRSGRGGGMGPSSASRFVVRIRAFESGADDYQEAQRLSREGEMDLRGTVQGRLMSLELIVEFVDPTPGGAHPWGTWKVTLPNDARAPAPSDGLL